MYSIFFKRVNDLVIAMIALVLLSPIFVVFIILLYVDYSGSPFFIQVRPGKNGKLFRIIKFKTMNDKTDKFGNLLQDEKRITRIGKFIRKTSLDEIPQLLNVIKGDMSLVGPRPLLIDYLPLYNEFQIRRHVVKPGITGWAQVNGRNAISWEEKFIYDVWYADNVSLKLDLKIIFLTIIKVLKKEGISQSGQATAEPFKGN